MMRVALAALTALMIPVVASAAATGADKPIIAPPAAWVRPAALPTDTAKPDGTALRLLLNDQQALLQPNGADVYSEVVVRVQTAEGLRALGTITLPWRPDTGTLTVHKMHIVRDGKIIDLLAKGPGFTVLRRENNLEYAMLDGVLTAVIQPEDLQVGDILDMATTTTNADPALGGNSEAMLVLAPEARVAHYQARLIWPDALPIRWRQLDGMPPVRVRKSGGQTELALSIDDVQPQITPKDAPPRFRLTRMVEATSLKSWADLSALFAPLYAKAATLKSDSPLKAEIARIAALTPDPVRRAEAALALTQDKVRYVFLGMNQGNLLPAEADLTWQRRFADCKGKTVLLLALLHGLGIEAAPAIVSTQWGDGMDARLPGIALFDHVIVRATIGGKIYWLDGTRSGDVRLADIRVPDFGFALPLRAPGATLEKLDVPVPARPLQEYSIKVDMTAGVTQPFLYHVEELSRGDAARATHLMLENMAPDVRQQALREYFAGQYPDVEGKTFAAAWDPASGEEKLVMDGLEKHDWRWAYEADHAGVGWKADFVRAAGPHSDAPFQVDYPAYTVAHETILLPNGGRAFSNQASDIDRVVAGVEYRRKAQLNGGTFTIDTSTRALRREFPAAEAAKAQADLRELAAQQPLLAIDGSYEGTAQEVAASIADPKTAYDYFRRAQSRLNDHDMTGALADTERAIQLEPSTPGPYFVRGILRQEGGKPAEALADMKKGVALAPAVAGGHESLARLLFRQGENTEALEEANRAITLDSSNPDSLTLRAQINRRLDRYDQALADSAAALKLKPQDQDIYQARTNIYLAMGQPEKALAEAQAGVATDPKSDMAHIFLGALYARRGRQSEAMDEFAKALAIKPSPEAYLTRANARPLNDAAGKRADIAEAAKLDPTLPEIQEMSLAIELSIHNHAAVIAKTTELLAKEPASLRLLTIRGAAYVQSNRQKEADKDFGAARAIAGTDPYALNALCWNKATQNVALVSALEDCDAALKIKPDLAQAADSRGFVLLRLGRYQDSVTAYDRALALRPNLAVSLYGRGVAKRHLGKLEEGNADIAAAKAVDIGIDTLFAGYGVKVS